MFINSVANLCIKKIISTNRLLNSPVGFTTYRTNREGWALILKVNGKTIYTVNGKDIVSDCFHPIILPKSCDYSWKCVEPGECITIEFEADEEEKEFSSFEIKDNSIIINAFSKIEKSLSAKKIYYKQECNAYLYEIIAFLIKSTSKEAIHPKKKNILNPAVKYINENYFDSEITNDKLSALCKISTVYFRKTFESVYGVSPIKYLNNFRINKAKAILRSDYETIEQVALSVGYNSIYHFSKMFKAHTGINPTEYAKTSRN